MDRRNFMKVLSLVPLGIAQIGFGSLLDNDSNLLSLPRLFLMDDNLDESYYSLRRPVRYEKDPRADAFISGRSTPVEDMSELKDKDFDGSGFARDTVVTSIYCLLTTKNYKEAVLKAVNFGDDTDTTACVTGGLAGIYYGSITSPERTI